MMSDNNLATIASEAHKVAIPEVHLPKYAPKWVREMFFSSNIQSIYGSCYNNIEFAIVDFNKSIAICFINCFTLANVL